MATAEASASKSASSFTPDSLPMGTDIMPWGQSVVRHLLPNRSRIEEVLATAGYHEPKVVNVIGGLLENIHKNPTSKEADLWHYRPEGSETGMAAHLRGGRDALVLTTTPHRNTGWEMQSGRLYDQDALTEYNGLYGTEKPGYKFKMVVFDPGPQGPEGPEGEEGVYDPNRLALASQSDRKLPWLGMRTQDWKLNIKGLPGRFALMYQTQQDGDNDILLRLKGPDGSKTTEVYRFIQREPGKVHVAVRAVNVSPTGW